MDAQAAQALATQLGVGGILTILILRQVFDFLKSRRPAAEPLAGAGREATGQHAAQAVPTTPAISAALKQIDEMHSWHNRRDADGVPVWYVKQDLRGLPSKQAETRKKLRAIEETLEKILRTQSSTMRAVGAVAELEARYASVQEQRVVEATNSVRTQQELIADIRKMLGEHANLLRELKWLVAEE